MVVRVSVLFYRGFLALEGFGNGFLCRFLMEVLPIVV